MHIRASTFLALCLLSEFAMGEYGLDAIPAGFKYLPGSELIVANMPRTRDQGGLGICYAVTATTLLEEANCNALGIEDCASLDDEYRLSVLDVSRFGRRVSEDDSIDYTDRFNYEGLMINGGSYQLALYQALNVGAIAKESCAPSTVLLGKNDNREAALKESLEYVSHLKELYEGYRDTAGNCPECAEQFGEQSNAVLRSEFMLRASDDDVREAFSQDSFEKFLDKLLVPDECWDVRNQDIVQGDWRVMLYPLSEADKNYQAMLQQIKQILEKQRPISLGYCAMPELTAKSQQACKGWGHSVVVKGYGRFCKKDKCMDALQLQNSWGEAWQSLNNDGWVDAKELIRRTFYETATMAWLE